MSIRNTLARKAAAIAKGFFYLQIDAYDFNGGVFRLIIQSIIHFVTFALFQSNKFLKVCIL